MNRLIFMVALAGWLGVITISPAAPEPAAERMAGRAGGDSEVMAPLPSEAQVIRRMLERSAALAAATNDLAWAYDKRTRLEMLDRDAKVKERTEKLYRVRIIRGVPLVQLVKVVGHDLSKAEIRQENEREVAWQKEFGGRDPKQVVKQREAFLSKELMERFEYQVLRHELVQGRPTVVVSFEPKPGRDSSSLQDRLLGRLAGKLWVDEASGDVARMQVQLTREFAIGLLGMLGAIKDLRMALEAKPMADGTWLPDKTTLSVSARMFLSNVRFQMEETSSHFTLEPSREPAQL